MRSLAFLMLAAGLISLGCNRPGLNNTPATNSARNARDANQPAGREPVTGQDETSEAVKITSEIRQRVLAEDFGTNADNIKILTSKGTVRLRGPVDTIAEKEKIVAIAKDVAGMENVIDEIEVVNAPATTTPAPEEGHPPQTNPKDAPQVLPPVTPPLLPPTDPPAPAPGLGPKAPEPAPPVAAEK